MVYYTCPKCNKSFKKKSHYIYHVHKRKRSCIPIPKENKITNVDSINVVNVDNLNTPKTNNVLHKSASDMDMNIDTNNVSSILEDKVYECLYCDRVFKYNGALKNHIFHQHINNTHSTISQQLNHTNSDYKIDKSFLGDNNVIIDNNKIYKCNYCQKNFCRKFNLERHLNSFCKVRKQIESQKENIYQALLSEMNSIKKQNNEIKEQNRQILAENKRLKIKVNNINNNQNHVNITSNNYNNNYNNITNTYNIKVVAFGKENMNSINDKVYRSILKKGFMSVPKMVEYTHLNKNLPENHNVYISNMRDNNIMVFDGIGWILEDKDDVLDRLYNDKSILLEYKFEDISDTLSETTKVKFQRFLDDIDNTEVKAMIKKNIKLLLYNKKDIPLNTRKCLEAPK